jgi:imidazole glycerol-phosphate synthase subunit HisH
MQRCAIIDYGSGNLRSAAKAFERAAIEADLDIAIEVTGDARTIGRADRIVLPGVGAFAECRRGLDAVPGLVAALERRVRAEGVPFLGICVGMQLLADHGLEHGMTAGLGWIAGDVLPIEGELKIPHMGWNDLRIASHPVLEGLETGMHAYFVHSYRFACADPATRFATVEYGGPITAAIGRDNLFGTQFHPEKSQATGLRLIGNFLRWRP